MSTVIESFDSSDCDWSSVEAINASGQKFARIKQVAYQVIGNGNKYYYAVIAIDNNANNEMTNETKKSNGQDLSDLEFDIKVAFKDNNANQLQHKTLKGVQISEQLENQNGYMIYKCLFLRVESE